MDHHSSQVGERAAKMLLRRLKDKTSGAARQIRLQPSLVIRESSRRRGRSTVPLRNGLD